MTLELAILLNLLSVPQNGLREVKSTSCKIVQINLSLGMTTQLVFEETPTMTLHADEEHIKVRSSPDAPRSVAIIPTLSSGVISQMFPQGAQPTTAEVAKALDQTFATNLFVFFKNGNQLVFQLRFVDKAKADYIVQVRQSFSKDCQL